MISENQTSPTPIDLEQLTVLYETSFGVGPFPLDDCRNAKISERLHGQLVMYLANIAGMASNGARLVTIPESRRQQFRKLAAKSFWEQCPQAKKKITPAKTPKLFQLIADSEIAREMISDYLGPDPIESPTP